MDGFAFIYLKNYVLVPDNLQAYLSLIFTRNHCEVLSFFLCPTCSFFSGVILVCLCAPKNQLSGSTVKKLIFRFFPCLSLSSRVMADLITY